MYYELDDWEEGFILRKGKIPTECDGGWLSPDGIFYMNGFSQHAIAAYVIVKTILHIKGETWLSSDEFLEARWVKLHSASKSAVWGCDSEKLKAFKKQNKNKKLAFCSHSGVDKYTNKQLDWMQEHNVFIDIEKL